MSGRSPCPYVQAVCDAQRRGGNAWATSSRTDIADKRRKLAAVLRALDAVAAQGLPCPRNSDLARMVGVREVSLQHMVSDLRALGLIRIHKHASDPRVRQILVVASGQLTDWSSNPNNRGAADSTQMPDGYSSLDAEREAIAARAAAVRAEREAHVAYWLGREERTRRPAGFQRMTRAGDIGSEPEHAAEAALQAMAQRLAARRQGDAR